MAYPTTEQMEKIRELEDTFNVSFNKRFIELTSNPKGTLFVEFFGKDYVQVFIEPDGETDVVVDPLAGE